ncbi:MAG: PKD domain-containing protein [Bacteroidetes bacterium]|nr:PKD domain-containing protein [Bacteroidota bacterium]
MLFLQAKSTQAQCITAYPHVEDFEVIPTWTAVTAPTSSVAGTCDWAWGTPNHTYVIHSAGSGNKCWSAGGLSGAFYNYNQQSYIYSPCYNFSTLQYPYIQFKLFYDIEYKFDGGNLQSSINGGVSWQDVGALGDPIDCNTANWYNYGNIKFLDQPAGFVPSKAGWCGNVETGGLGWDPTHPGTACVGGNGVGQWVTAKHCLTGLAGQPSVMFRFTLGAGYTCNDFDGFAIDSVAIGNGMNNSATFTHSCASVNTINFSATPNACPTNTYLWDFGDAASGASNASSSQTPSHTFSAPGSYTVMLIASGGNCNPPDTIKQTVNILSASLTSFSNTSCSGLGSATVSVTSGVAPINYTWSPSGGNASTASNLAAGNYTCSISDAASCPTTVTVAIAASSSFSVTVNTTPAACSSAGSATAIPSGGATPYTYTWSPSGGNANTASNLTAGNYSVLVVDNTGCSVTTSLSITSSGSGITATVSSSSVTCNAGNNGSATVTINGGTTPYTYTWSPGGGNSSVANNLSAGTYTVESSDANGCTNTMTVSVTQPPPLTVTVTFTNVSCYGGTNGAALASASGGSGGYHYSWTTSPPHHAAYTTMPAGVFNLLIFDTNSCLTITTVTIGQPPPITLTTTTSSVTCNGGTGTASITPSGGTPGYSYTWTPSGGSGPSATIPAGTYTVLISDSHSCLTADTIQIAQPPALTTATTATATTCGLANGSASVTAGGGTPGYTYNWIPSGGNAALANNITGGTYTVIVSDANSCTLTATVPVTPSNSLSLSETQTNVSCFGLSDGSANVSVHNGTPTYTYTWAPNSSTTNTANNLPAGTYSVNVTDTHSCVASLSLTITQPAPLSTTLTAAATTCHLSNGTASASASGGTPIYNFSWMPGGLVGASEDNLASGTYTVITTDADHCKDTTTVSVAPSNGAPAINFSENPGFGCSPVCALFSAVAAPVANDSIVSWTWLFGDGSMGNGDNPNHCYTISGTYSVGLIATDQHGCMDTLIKFNVINVYPKPIANFYATPYNTDIFSPAISFYDQSQSNITSWQWAFGDNSSSSIQNPEHTYTNPGTYPVELIVTNSSGCKDTTIKDVTIKPVYTFYAPNCFTPDGDGLNETFMPVGTGWDNSSYHLWIFDRWGLMFYQSTIPEDGWNGTYHNSSVQEDVYVWKVSLKDVFGQEHEYHGIVSVVR